MSFLTQWKEYSLVIDPCSSTPCLYSGRSPIIQCASLLKHDLTNFPPAKKPCFSGSVRKQLFTAVQHLSHHATWLTSPNRAAAPRLISDVLLLSCSGSKLLEGNKHQNDCWAYVEFAAGPKVSEFVKFIRALRKANHPLTHKIHTDKCQQRENWAHAPW